MQTVNIPFIAEAEFGAVKSLIKNGFHYDYLSWLDLRVDWKDMYKDYVLRDVNVTAADLAAFLDATGRSPDADSLIAFAKSL